MNKAKEVAELIVVLCCVVACHVAQKTEEMELPAFDKEGHRGCRALMPENTVPAMIRAIDLGVTTLEMDAVITSDSQVILSHEPFFNHEITTKPDGEPVQEAEERSLNIYGMTYAATQQFDVGLKPHPRFPGQQKMAAHKPLLSTVIDSVEQYVNEHDKTPVFYNIETKTNPATDGVYHPKPEVFVPMLMKVIEAKGIAARVIIQSFDFRTLQIIHRDYPQVRTAALVEEYDSLSLAQHIQELGFVPTIYSPAYGLVTDSLVQQCHDKEIKLVPWTVDDATDIARLKQMGVDGIITDDPRLLSQ